MQLTFNTLLETAGIEPVSVRLLRHRDPMHQRQVYRAAIDRDPRFEQYQSEQSDSRVVGSIRSADYIAGFVVDDRGESVFAGLWKVHGESVVKHRDASFPGMASTPGPHSIFSTERVESFDIYRGRLLIDWGPGHRVWVQRADRQDKPIVELRRIVSDPPFPGYLSFKVGLSEVEALPGTWLSALRAVGGIYLLVHRELGKLYVGSACGADGFLGRWLSYRDGHGGNLGMLELEGAASDYDVTILETAGSGLEEREVLALEARWKDKLGSRAHGLNRN